MAICDETNGRLLSVDAEGHKIAGDWMSISKAAHDGLSFMVWPNRTILAVDADTDEQVAALTKFATRLRGFGFAPVYESRGVVGIGSTVW